MENVSEKTWIFRRYIDRVDEPKIPFLDKYDPPYALRK